MELPICPLDITYCGNADCKNRRCERHPSMLAEVRRRFPCAMVSVADFSGSCIDYIREIVEENENG